MLLGGSAHAQLQLDLYSNHTSLRFEVPDALYAAGVGADFSAVELRDKQGRRQEFAVCPISLSRLQQHSVPVLALPDLARPKLMPDGSLDYSRPAGAGPIEHVSAWILDFRAVHSHVRRLSGMPSIRSLQLSPNLQQWSGEIRYSQDQDQLTLEPRPLTFVRIKPSELTAWDSPLPQIELTGEAHSGQRQPHWFDPPAQADGSYLNNRTLPVFAARLQPAAAQDWQLQSRQGAWDAWKPRGQLGAGEAAGRLLFSAVSDPQWRIPGQTDARLQLAHAAHELRLPQMPEGGVVRMIFQPGKRLGPNLSCAGTATLQPSAPQRIEVIETQPEKAGSDPLNLRNAFLVLLTAVILLATILRRFLLRRRAG